MVQAAQSEQALADADAERLRLGVVRTPRGFLSKQISQDQPNPKIISPSSEIATKHSNSEGSEGESFFEPTGSDSFHGSLTHIQARTLETT